MKALYLYLVFSHLGPVGTIIIKEAICSLVNSPFAGVMQSSRYVTGIMADARRVCAEDTELLSKNGLQVIRQKIEAVSGITEVRFTAKRVQYAVFGCFFSTARDVACSAAQGN